MPSKAEIAKRAMLVKEEERELGKDDFLSTGVTLINLATYGQVDRGIAKGHVYRFIGGSSSGKTFMARTILAEAVRNPNFDEYELIYDDVEHGALMDTKKFFGDGLVKRLIAPAYTKKKDPIYSVVISDFYTRISKKLSEGKKIIWVEDSLDSLKPDAENKMTDGKAKVNSQELRKLLDPLKETGSILILISQTRQMMNSMFGGETWSGGTALEFYSTAEIWLKKIKTLEAVYKGKKYPIGSLVKARVKKNRLSGQDRSIIFPFYPTYGIDDIGANVDFLCTSKHWVKDKGTIKAEDFEFSGSRKELLRKIEEEELQDELQELVGQVYQEIEDACNPKRKPRYE